MLRFIKKASGETDFLLKYPEEFSTFTLEQEKAFIRGDYDNPNGMMIACIVDGNNRRELPDCIPNRNERLP